MELVLCSGCERHIQSDEGACPFCGVTRGPRSAKAGLGATVALGLGLAVAGCGDDPTPPATDLGADSAMVLPDLGPGEDGGPGVDAGPADAGPDDAGMMALYGPPPLDAGQPPEPDLGGPLPAYGPPPPFDAGA